MSQNVRILMSPSDPNEWIATMKYQQVTDINGAGASPAEALMNLALHLFGLERKENEVRNHRDTSNRSLHSFPMHEDSDI